jgi:hypothetical protein
MLGGVYDVVESMGSLKKQECRTEEGIHIFLSVSIYIVRIRSPFPFADCNAMNSSKEARFYQLLEALPGNRAIMSIHGDAQQEESPHDRRRGRSHGGCAGSDSESACGNIIFK